MYNMPKVTKNLLIINVLVFLFQYILNPKYPGMSDIANYGVLHFFLAKDFHVYQFITYMFMHGGWTHLLFNMFAVWMFGSVMERVWGPKKFLFYYIVCGIGAGIIQEMVQLYFFADIPTLGASGAVYGILLAFGMTFPNERLFIIPFPFPIKAKWLILGYIVIELVSAMGQSDGVAHMAHLGGMLFGFLLIRYWQKHPGSSQRYGRSYGKEFFDNLIRKHEDYQRKRHMHAEQTKARRETDEEYNMRQRQNQEEIDAILDKIRKSGYDSLTKEEKQKLFDQKRPS